MALHLCNLNPFALAGLILSVSSFANAGLINTTTTHTGNWEPFGESNTATYGQTFTITGDNVLNSFSLFLAGSEGVPLDFKGYLYEWDGNKATGLSLFTSTAQQFTGSLSNSPTEFSFLTGALSLNIGSTYVAFLSTSELFDGISSTALMPYAGSYGSEQLAGGNFVYYNNGSDFSSLTSNTWNKTSGIDDVWFKANLVSEVPEPSTLVIFALGIMGLTSRRFKKQ